MIKALAAAALIFTAAAPAMADPNVDYGCGRSVYCGNDLNAFKQKIKSDVCGDARNGAEAFEAAMYLTGVMGKAYESGAYEQAGKELAVAAMETVAVENVRGRCRTTTYQFISELDQL